MVRRLGGLGILFSLELAAITLTLDNDQIAGRTGLIGFFHDWGPLILRGVVVFATLFLTFACLKFSSTFIAISEQMAVRPVLGGLLLIHGVSLGLFAAASGLLFYTHAAPNAVALVWLVSGLCAIGSGAAAFVPAATWYRIGRSTGYLWIVALAAAVAAGFGGNAMRLLWPWATSLTFTLVQFILRPFGIFSGNPSNMSIGSQRFSVEIAPTCSGLEGMGLIIAFTLVWLFLFRKECRFPQALILLPLGVVVLFLLNSARIAALILIGNAGFERIALGGFHSQAGWIGFNLVALGTSVAAREVNWISKRPARVAVANPTAVWVMPFVAILAAGMASHAVTGGFEWTYPVRFFAALVVLWFYRDRYSSIDSHIDWTGPLAGVAVFAIWMVLDHSVPVATPAELAAAPPGLQFGWLAVRVAAAVITVPIAEELAFRGFLLRRLISPEFENVPFRHVSYFAILASSVLFGLLHGGRWIAGSAAGLIFALVVIRRGRFGNAVVAHAVANALIAVEVLAFHHWDLW